MRVPWWSALLAATAVGAGIGLLVAAAGESDYKAEAKVVVQADGGAAAVRPLMPNVRELATSSLLAGNVDSTLRLPGSADSLRKRLHASIAPSSQVIVLSVTDPKRDRARQIAQEAAVVLTQLVQARFRTPPLKAAVLDPAHVVSHHGRHFLRDALIGGAIGFLVAAVALLVVRRGVTAAPPVPDEKLAARKRQLEERIDLVTKRERELARRAGDVARRERSVEAHEQEARRREAPPPAPVAPPAPEPAPQAAPVAVTVERRAAGWNLNDLERLVEHQDAPRERVEEWRTYVLFLRPHTDVDGDLPASFDSLVEDVFADLVRAG
jgi:capsular polysaccharide biosynthesis protein